MHAGYRLIHVRVRNSRRLTFVDHFPGDLGQGRQTDPAVTRSVTGGGQGVRIEHDLWPERGNVLGGFESFVEL